MLVKSSHKQHTALYEYSLKYHSDSDREGADQILRNANDNRHIVQLLRTSGRATARSGEQLTIKHDQKSWQERRQ